MKSINAKLRTLFAVSIITLIATAQIKADTAMARPAVSKSKFEIRVEEIISQPIPESEKIVNYDKPAEKEPDDSYDATHSTQKQINCIASAMHYEASGEPVEGQIAVAEVILNRVKSRRFKGTPCMVVAQKSQFSFVRRGNIPDVPEKKRKAMQNLAAKVVNGEVQSKVKGSLFFHATRVKPKWKLKKNGKIGNHVFYK